MNEITMRQLKILLTLIESTLYITGNDLSNKIEVSSKTIRIEIKSLNTLLRDNGAQIISIPSKGYILKVFEETLFEKFINRIKSTKKNPSSYIERAYYITSILLQMDNFIKIIDISELLYLDRTAVSRSLKYVRSFISKYDVELIQKPSYGIKLEGKEFNWRIMYGRIYLS